jgi:hypothetical protein
MVHVVLRGTFKFKAAGFDEVTANKGDVIVHPIKYYVKLIPRGQWSQCQVLTIII